MMQTIAFVILLQSVDPGPPAFDRHRFCLRETARANWLEAQSFRLHAAKMRAIELAQTPAERGRWEAILHDARWCERVWARIDDAYCYEKDEQWCRHYLRLLKMELGDRAYFAGVLPPPIPVWMFEWID